MRESEDLVVWSRSPAVRSRAERFRNRLDRSKARLREAVNQLQEAAHEMTPAARIAERPYGWVLGALVVGFTVGWLTSRPRR